VHLLAIRTLFYIITTSSHRYRGRTRTHQRDTDDAAPILGKDISIRLAHQDAICETKSHDRELNTKRNMRNWIKHIIDFWEATYPAYYAVGVHKLTPDDLSDPDKYFHKNTSDIIYSGLNVKMVFAFMVHKKHKSNGQTCSHVQLRKYNDAILWGAMQAKELLPSSYYNEMKEFLEAFKKETATAKSEGQLDEQEADPINPTLFRCILQWAIENKNIFYGFSHCASGTLWLG